MFNSSIFRQASRVNFCESLVKIPHQIFLKFDKSSLNFVLFHHQTKLLKILLSI